MINSKFIQSGCLAMGISLALFSSQGFSWEIKADFEDGSIGAVAYPSSDAFHEAADNSLYAASPVLSGNQSGSVSISEGDTGFGKWGGVFNFPSDLGEGDSLWYRVNVYFPTDWSFSCGGCNEGMKFMRVRTASASNGHEGYIHNHLRSESADGSGGLIKPNNELYDPPPVFNLGNPVQRNQWHTYEVQVKFSSVAGQGIYRIWQDGELIFEDLDTPTLLSSTSQSNSVYLFTYWNIGAPRTQTAYVDDIVITNEVPGRTDANGNPFIGVGSSVEPTPEPPPIVGIGTGVAKVWTEYNPNINPSDATLWATFTETPDDWIIFPSMAGAALNIINAAGSMNPDITLYGSVNLQSNGLYYDMLNLSVSGGSDAPGHVRDMFFLNNSLWSPKFAYAAINDANAGIISTVEQAAIAATSLVQKKPVDHTVGTVYFFNTITQQTVQIDNVITNISMPD